MGEALSELQMFGLDGLLHYYPHWLCVFLQKTNRGLVRSGLPPILDYPDRETKFMRILPRAVTVLGPLLDLPAYSPMRRVKANDPGFHSGRPKHCGKRGLIDLLECGIDQAVERRNAEKCAADLDRTHLPGRGSGTDIDQISRMIREIKAKRRAAV